MKFYSRWPGSRVIMPSGKPLAFSGEGVFETDDKDEIKEMEYQVKEGYADTKPLPIVKNDAVILKDVGTPKPGGTGMVNSAALAAISAESSSSSK